MFSASAFGQSDAINLESSVQALEVAQTLSSVHRTERAQEHWPETHSAGAAAAFHALVFFSVPTHIFIPLYVLVFREGNENSAFLSPLVFLA